MAGVQAGGDRQDLHERIRVHSQEAGRLVKEQGSANDLIERLQADPAFSAVDLTDTLNASRYIGRAAEQVDEFINEIITPIRDRYTDDLTGATADVRV
jgi:adenylosuccinate lyase